MHAGLYGYERKLGTKDLVSFIKLEYGRIGADQNITPREVIRDFIELLDLLYQNPLHAPWRSFWSPRTSPMPNQRLFPMRLTPTYVEFTL